MIFSYSLKKKNLYPITKNKKKIYNFNNFINFDHFHFLMLKFVHNLLKIKIILKKLKKK